jgi:hypothetical protein
MRRLKRILLLVGRYVLENPYRELLLKHELEARGLEVLFAIPGMGINKAGFPEEALKDPVFAREQVIYLDGEWDFKVAIRGCQGVLFSTWRSYSTLVNIARREGLPTINFNSFSGQDHWPNGVDHCLVRSEMTKQLLVGERSYKFSSPVAAENMTVVGSIAHAHFDGVPAPTLDREGFCKGYNMDPKLPIVVLFPTSIGAYRVKLHKWFPDWTQKQIENYITSLIDQNIVICKGVKRAKCNLLIKLHPAAYASYWSQKDAEYELWQQINWARILAPEDSLSMYQHMDIGVGINTNASMDPGYYKKPFIYLAPISLAIPPALVPEEIEACCTIPLGPSSQWHTNPEHSPTPWMTSWLGWYCQATELSDLLLKPETFVVDPVQAETYIKGFWNYNDNRTSARIADHAIKIFEQKLSLGNWSMTLSRVRSLILNTLRSIIKNMAG